MVHELLERRGVHNSIVEIANSRPDQDQGGYNYNDNQGQDKSVFHQALPLFRCK
jgi:hypothetical protein